MGETGEIGETFIPEPQKKYLSIKKQILRRNFFTHFDTDNPTPGITKDNHAPPAFELHAAEPVTAETQHIFSQINRLRRTVYFPLRLRGTAAKFMYDAQVAGKIGTKPVDDPYEDDSGFVATYKMVLSDERMDDQELLYLLQITTTSALEYAARHAGLYSNLIPTGKVGDELETQLQSITEKLKNVDDGNLSLVLCFADDIGYRRATYANTIKPSLVNSGAYHPGNTAYTTDSARTQFDLWGSPHDTFLEGRFKQHANLADYNPEYITIQANRIGSILQNLKKPDSPERKFLDERIQQHSKTQKRPTIIRDTLLYLLGEDVTLEVLDKMNDLPVMENLVKNYTSLW